MCFLASVCAVCEHFMKMILRRKFRNSDPRNLSCDSLRETLYVSHSTSNNDTLREKVPLNCDLYVKHVMFST